MKIGQTRIIKLQDGQTAQPGDALVRRKKGKRFKMEFWEVRSIRNGVAIAVRIKAPFKQ